MLQTGAGISMGIAMRHFRTLNNAEAGYSTRAFLMF